jgi:hypothetical protein
VALFLGPSGGVQTPVGLDDGAYITDLPGFLEHTDEVRCENGIPRNCLTITDTDIVVDLEGTSFAFVMNIRRSFHFNCIVRLIRVNGEVRAALYATRLKSPLIQDKSRRVLAIEQGSELFLPFDGGIPFPIEKIEWKQKKQQKVRKPRFQSEDGRQRPSPMEKQKSEEQKGCELTLLSAWLSDEMPTLPIVILSDDEAVEKYKAQERTMKVRSRRPKEAD